ncbi:hypothetical protein CQW23_22654 [Capsicum baccatum]|uniref:USP domain-containing protein n=1 Tax=Capsicum baccatum TaxID=33114 RepID=A0A2G2W1I4_CAPBA|nr:hypothetical protein CQW23_22654 [Capsicum baccatum]
MALMEKVGEEEEGWERCLEAKSRAINTLASINLEIDWVRSNTIHNVEQKCPDKNQEDSGDVVAAIEEIKEEDPEIGRKSLNVKNVEVHFEETVSKNQYASDDIIGERIKEDIVKFKVLDQSSIISRSIIGLEKILEVDEKVKDLMNDEAPISDGEIYNMLEELEMKSSGGFCYDTKDSHKINDQIIIESNEDAATDEIFLYYEVSSERVNSKILNPRASSFSFPCVSTDFSSGFCKYQQEDAHVFLQCFLNRLESRCNDIVQQVFGGRLVNKLCCCNCGHCSNTYDPLIDVSLEINDADSLHSALESFTRVEKLDDPEIKYTFERCKVQVSIEKQLMLYNAPSVAVFHLKRFQNDDSVVRKVDKHVSFPLELDLLPYTENIQSYNISRVHKDLVLAEEAYTMFYAKRDTLWFSDFVALQLYNVDTIRLLYLSLLNNHASYVSESNSSVIDTSSSAPRPTGAINSSDFHELTKIAENELKKTVQMSTLGLSSALNSSKENNASQDIGVTERTAPLLPKSLGKLIFNFYVLVAFPYKSDIPRVVWNPPLTRRGSLQSECAARVGVSESDTPQDI